MVEDKLYDPISKISIQFTTWEDNSTIQITQFLQQMNGTEEGERS